MFHTIEFSEEFTLDLVISRKLPMERLLIAKGTRAQAQIKPYVVEEADGPVEVADFFFEDGTVAQRVKFALFAFIDK